MLSMLTGSLGWVAAYKDAIVEATRPVLNSDKGGLFLDSCFLHCQVAYLSRKPWGGGCCLFGALSEWSDSDGAIGMRVRDDEDGAGEM